MPPRIEEVSVRGQVRWRKQREHLGLRMRIQKGNAAAAFERELSFYQSHSKRGLPIPRLLDVGQDFFELADAGLSVRSIVRQGDPAGTGHVLQEAAKALAHLHREGVVHGRPALKDLCWDGKQITFVDWERYRPALNTPRGMARDVLLFFFDAIANLDGAPPQVEAARQTYAAEAPPTIMPLVRQRVRRLRPLRAVLAPAIRKLAHKREFRAVDPFFAFFLDDP